MITTIVWSRVSIRVIAVSVTRIAIIAARRSNPNSPNSDRNLSVRTLHGNENQSTYHQCNQKKIFHIFSLLFFIINNVIYLIGECAAGRILQKIDRFLSASACLSNHDDYIVAAGHSDVLPRIRGQKRHSLRHRSHCRYRHRPQSAPRVLAQGLPRPAVGFMDQQNGGEE